MTGVDLVLQGGTVRTGDSTGTRARALAVHGGRVVALDLDALALADDAREVVDLDGGALLPAFADGHVHPLWGGVELAGATGPRRDDGGRRRRHRAARGPLTTRRRRG